METEARPDLALHEVDEAAERERRAVDLAHEEPLQDHSVEVALGPPNKEAVQLRQHTHKSGGGTHAMGAASKSEPVAIRSGRG